MTPDIDTARGALKRGASLADAAQAGGFQFAADLDLALWAELPGPSMIWAPTLLEMDARNRGLSSATGQRHDLTR